MKIHESIIKDIERLEIEWDALDGDIVLHKMYKGSNAVWNYKCDEEGIIHDQLNYIIRSYNLLINQAKKIYNAKNKNNLLISFYLSFYTRILWGVIEDPTYYEYIKLIERVDDAPYVFIEYSNLSIEAINYLANKNVIAKPIDETIDPQKYNWKRETIIKLNLLKDKCEKQIEINNSKHSKVQTT